MADGRLIDRCGRPIRSLRVSVTDRCNLRCRYCMPAEGVPLAPKSSLLDFEGITRAVRVAASLGVTRIRVTGGEPLLRRDLPELLAMLAREPGVTDLSLTTNAVLLERHVEALRDSGVRRLNVSLDSLRPDRFEQMTRMAALEDAWRGIRAASAAGFDPIKINSVVLAGFNDDELDEWVELTREANVVVRFLELMPIGEGAEARRLGGYCDLTQRREELVKRFALEAVPGPGGNGPAVYLRAPGAAGLIGFITPLSNPYCDRCTRFRLTSTGGVRPCLAQDLEISIADAVRAGDDAAIAAGFREAAALKADGHAWRAGGVTETSMSTLGG